MANYGVRTELRDNIWHLRIEQFSTERLSTKMEHSISKPLSPHLENRKEILTSFLEKAPAYKHCCYQRLEGLLGGREMGLAVMLDEKRCHDQDAKYL